jgi:hypothetical protein
MSLVDSLIENYLLIRVSQLARDVNNVETVVLVTANILNSVNVFITSTFVPLYANVYPDSTMTITVTKI